MEKHVSQGKTILVVGDDEDIGAAFQLVLTDYGRYSCRVSAVRLAPLLE